MTDLKFNELIRYLTSGGAALLLFMIGFTETTNLILGAQDGIQLGAIWVSFVVGALSYAAFRATFYQPIYFIAKKMAGRSESLRELDIKRWKYSEIDGSLLIHMKEWAAQIFLLLTSSVTAMLGLFIGHFFNLTPSNYYTACVSVSVALFISGLISNVRYHSREKKLFELVEFEKID